MPEANLIPLFALVGSVILMASLFSGIVERTGFPQVALFLLLGLGLGPHFLGIVDLPLHSPGLEAISVLGLALVLFTDAVSLDVGATRRSARVATILLGPGALLPAILNTVAIHLLLGWSWPQAAILGAALASTDPVLLRSLLRHPRLPRNVRSALRIESGMNDAVLLPIIAVAIIATGAGEPGAGLGGRLIGLFLLGPALGLLVGWLGIKLLMWVRGRWGVRRDYESLYALGIALTSFAIAEAVGGSGFLSAFGAGLVIAIMDVELCDCFHDYGEATAEMLLLLTFVAFGAALMWTSLDVISVSTVAVAAIVLLTRTLILFPALALTSMPREEARMLAWLGPRGLSSLLLVMLAVIARVDGAEEMFAVASLVVLASLLLHGGGILWLTQRRLRNSELPEAPPEGVTLDQLKDWRATGKPYVLIDARADRSWETDSRIAKDAVRVSPDDPVRDARALGLTQRGTMIVYCA